MNTHYMEGTFKNEKVRRGSIFADIGPCLWQVLYFRYSWDNMFLLCYR